METTQIMQSIRKFYKVNSTNDSATLTFNDDYPINTCSIRLVGFTNRIFPRVETSVVKFSLVDLYSNIYPFVALINPYDSIDTILNNIKEAAPDWEIGLSYDQSTGLITITSAIRRVNIINTTYNFRQGLVYTQNDGGGGTVITSTTQSTPTALLAEISPILGTTNLRSWDLGAASPVLQQIARSVGGITIGILGTTLSFNNKSITLGTTPTQISIGANIAAVNFGATATIYGPLFPTYGITALLTITSSSGIETCLDICENDQFILFGSKIVNFTTGGSTTFGGMSRPRAGRLMPNGTAFLTNSTSTLDLWGTTGIISGGVSTFVSAGTTVHYISPIISITTCPYIMIQSGLAAVQYTIGITSNLVNAVSIPSFTTASYFGARMGLDGSVYLATTTTLEKYTIPRNISIGYGGDGQYSGITWTSTPILAITSSEIGIDSFINLTSVNGINPVHERYYSGTTQTQIVHLAKLGQSNGLITTIPYEPDIPIRQLQSIVMTGGGNGQMIIEVISYLTRIGDAYLSSSSNISNLLDYNKIFHLI